MNTPKISMKIRLKANSLPVISEAIHQIFRKNGLIDLQEECIHYRDAGNARQDMSKFAISIVQIESKETLLSAVEEWKRFFYRDDGTVEYEDILEAREICKEKEERWQKKNNIEKQSISI